jgi:hypothetical protein
LNYASGIGGDAIDYIAKTRNCTPLEAKDILVKEFNITFPAAKSQSASE